MITREDFKWLKKQNWFQERNSLANGDYEIIKNDMMLNTLRKPYEDLVEDDINFLSVWLKKLKVNTTSAYFATQRECLQLVATKQEDDATELIVEKIMENEYIYSTKNDHKSEMWIYCNGIYLPNGESEVRVFSREFLGKAYTPQRANKVIAKIRADTFIDEKDFFEMERKNIYEQPLTNGILNIKTREMTEFTPNKVFFNKLPITYDENCKCDKIKSFFEDILKSEDDVRVIYEMFGFILLRKYLMQKAFMFIGSGANGKSKLLQLIKLFIGSNNISSTPLNQLQPDSSGVCELFGKLANISGDLDNSSLKRSGIFKELTGGDTLSAKRKFLTDLNFENYAKLIFACNDLPKVYDLSDGFWRRWVLLEFPFKFLPENEYFRLDKKDIEKNKCKIADPKIIERITDDDELSGLLNMALDGLNRLFELKDFSVTIGTKQVKETWIRKSNSFIAFCLDSLDENFDGFVTKKELRRQFNVYCKKHKIKGAGDKEIKAILQDKYGVIESRKMINADYDYVWEGIKFL